MRRHNDPPTTASERELHEHRRRDERRERWLFSLSVITLVIVLAATAVWVVRSDRTQASELRAQDAELRAQAVERRASCLRGEALRAYVRLDNELALAFIQSVADGGVIPARLLAEQTAARKAIATSASFRKGLCNP